MKNKELAQKIKALRNRKGFSQEELSEKAGLSLRTIQRIENGETEPRGDSLKRISVALNVSSDEILDWAVQEDKGLLTNLNLSALSFLLFPLLGILVPLIIWISKKDKIRGINNIAKDILNFQITWSIFIFIGYIGLAISAGYKMKMTGYVDAGIISSRMMIYFIFLVTMYLYNLISIITNTVRINNEKKVGYYPKIRFIR